VIPAGYMAKRISQCPDWLKAPRVEDIYSVSGCVSEDFADYINFWRHNGYWFFDSPEVIREIADEHAVPLEGTALFFYEVYEQQYLGDNEWEDFQPESSFTTCVVAPESPRLQGFDVVTFSVGTIAECSPLSCNHLAGGVDVNPHCLLETFEYAKRLLEEGRFDDSEPGPYRIFAVYRLDWP
jgi:hypothetical protein